MKPLRSDAPRVLAFHSRQGRRRLTRRLDGGRTRLTRQTEEQPHPPLPPGPVIELRAAGGTPTTVNRSTHPYSERQSRFSMPSLTQQGCDLLAAGARGRLVRSCWCPLLGPARRPSACGRRSAAAGSGFTWSAQHLTHSWAVRPSRAESHWPRSHPRHKRLAGAQQIGLAWSVPVCCVSPRWAAESRGVRALGRLSVTGSMREKFHREQQGDR